MSAEPLIAIVDDDPSALEAMAALVRSLGFAATGHRSAEDFIASADVGRTACLIADVQMPGMTGLELHLSLVAAGWSIPTLLVTAYPNEAIERRALRAGVRRCLAKPFRPAELLACILAALDEAPPGAPGT